MPKKKKKKKRNPHPQNNNRQSGRAAVGRGKVNANFTFDTPELSPEAVKSINDGMSKAGKSISRIMAQIADRMQGNIPAMEAARAQRAIEGQQVHDAEYTTAIEVGTPHIDGALMPPNHYEEDHSRHKWTWEVVTDEISVVAQLAKDGPRRGELRIFLHRVDPGAMSVEYAEKAAQGLLSACVIQSTGAYQKILSELMVSDVKPGSPTIPNNDVTVGSSVQTPPWIAAFGAEDGDDEEYDIGKVQG